MNSNEKKVEKFKKRSKNYIQLCLNCDIRAKSKCGIEDRAQIQKDVIECMKKYNYKQIKGDIAVEIITYTEDKKLPGIDKWAKNIIDILHKQEYLLDSSDRQFLPFVDDDQIRYLYIKYNYIETTPTTYINIFSFNNFIKDVSLASELKDHNYLLNNDEYFDFPIDSNDSEINEIIRKLNLSSRQTNFGKLIRIDLDTINSLFRKKSKIPNDDPLFKLNKSINNVIDGTLKSIMNSSSRILLNELPEHGSNDKEIANNYKKNIKEKIVDYLNKYPIFYNIQNPLILSVIYIPGTMSNAKEKDIDNILLEYIVPVFNQKLCPPAAIGGLETYKDLDGKDIKVPLAKDKKGQIIGYEILKLKKSFMKQGSISVSLLTDFPSSSIIEESHKIINNLNRDF